MVVDASPALQVNVDWEDARGVSTPELAATWARLSITAGLETITLVSDARSTSTRNSIYAPTYSLAEWCAFNWWQIDSNYRPGFLHQSKWHASTAGGPQSSWVDHHSTKCAGDGIPWPDLVFLPSAHQILVSWAGYRSSELSYLSSGQIELPKDVVQRVLAEFVETVVERLRQFGIAETPLQHEWEAIKSTSADEADFCRSAARLGLDPLSLSESMSDLIVHGASVLEADLLEDFLVSADPAHLESDLKWTENALESLHSINGAREPLPDLDLEPLDMSRPWSAGYADARRFRLALRAAPTEAVDVSQFVEAYEDLGAASQGLVSIGARSASRSVRVINARPHGPFVDARAIWRALRSDRAFMISSASLPLQKTERAFAAELLAPSEGLGKLLPKPSSDTIDLRTVTEISAHFRVSELVVEHQLENHFGIAVESRDW